MRKLLIALMMIFTITGAAQATTVNFDTFSGNSGAISSPYAGFDWGWNAQYMRGTYHPGTGFAVGTVSGSYSLFNAYSQYGYPLNVTRADNSVFTFNSAYFTSAWNTGLNIDIEGYLGATQLYSTTITVDTLAATLFTLNFEGIDKLVFTTYGGTDYSATDGGQGTMMVMDDFTYNEPVGQDPAPVPEPSTVALLLAGFAGLIGFSIKRRS